MPTEDDHYVPRFSGLGKNSLRADHEETSVNDVTPRPTRDPATEDDASSNMIGDGSNVEMTAVMRPLPDNHTSYDNHSYVNDSRDDVRVNVEQLNATNSAKSQLPVFSPPEEVDNSHDRPAVLQRFHKLREKVDGLCRRYRPLLKRALLFLLFTLYNVYLGFAVHINWDKNDTWCSGVKFLTLITVFAYCGLLYFRVIKPLCARKLNKKGHVGIRLQAFSDRICGRRWSGLISLLAVLTVGFIFVAVDAAGQKSDRRLVSFAGILSLLVFGFVFSKHPTKVIFRHVAWGIGLQFVFALLILRWEVGKDIFGCLGEKVASFLFYSSRGADFVFSYLSSGNLASGNVTMDGLDVDGTFHNATAVNMVLPKQFGIFAFAVLPVVLFFSFIVSILYYYGIMQWVVMKVGWLLQVTIGTTAAESMSAAANIFMGQTESPLLVKPYLPLMTKSELHAIMTGGFATIAGSVMAAYVSLGISPSHLLSASLMSAPAALAYSKLFYPETEISQTTAQEIRIEKSKERNALEAATNGVTVAISLVANIAANLIAFTAFIYFVDELIMWLGSLVGWPYLSLTYILSLVFSPLAYLMGVPWEECQVVAELIGTKTVLNEFIAYDRLSKLKHTLSVRAQVISTYALCGFANVASIGIQLGAISAMAPSRTSDLAQVVLRAMIAGSAACFLTACIAGALLVDETT